MRYVKTLKSLYIVGFLFVILCTLSLYNNHLINARAVSSSPDAIAIRVIPNPDNFSAERWYANQKFTGSPQSIIVDGYRGVRDGRTVYVDTANIDEANNFYTNIYLISYNQAAERATIDIFAQILSHWKFNINKTDSGNCQKSVDTDCYLDSDCAGDDYCGSQKARIIRDTRRLEDMAEIKIALEEYRNENDNKYPTLPAGSYLPHKTISVWPSWQNVLAQYLKGQKLPVDPINKLGDCGGERFNPITCWDEDNKEFAGTVPDGLPEGSRVYAYSAEAPYNYHLCAQWETTYSNLPNSCTLQVLENNPPVFTGVGLSDWPSNEFKGFVIASDPDDDRLTWSIDTTASDWSSWSSAPKIERISGYNNQIHINAALSGRAGNYPVTVRVTDSRGLFAEKTYIIAITPYAMELSNSSDEIIIGQSGLSWTLNGLDASKKDITTINFDSAYLNGSSLTEAELNNQGFNLAGVSLHGNYTPSQRTGNYIVNVYAADPTVGTRVNSFFNVVVKNNPPEIMSFPEASVIVGSPLAMSVNASDPDGHSLSYAIVRQPAGGNLSINNSGQITGTPVLHTGDYDITVRVSDQYVGNTIPPYKASSSQSSVFHVVNHPPEFSSVEITYADNSTDNCAGPSITASNCSFAINNGENAVVRTAASDPDPGHIVTYALTDDLGGSLSINANSGIISGLGNLNSHNAGASTFTIGVRASDQYCGRSLENECSNVISFTLNIVNHPPEITSFPEASVIVGSPLAMSVSASDPDGNSLSYAIVSQPAGGNLSINNSGQITGTPNLHTGDYNITVRVSDQYVGNTTPPYEDSSSQSSVFHVVNHPPKFSSVEITYADNSTDNCVGPSITASNCSFAINNGENAVVRTAASDPDPGHTVTYALTDDFGGSLSINANSGTISGLENLNSHNAAASTFTIGVRASDQYCGRSDAHECSNVISFTLNIGSLCSVIKTDVGYVNSLHFSSPAELIMGQGETASNNLMNDIGFPAPDNCSSIGNAIVDITASGIGTSKAIIFVSDLSGSMDGSDLFPAPAPGNQPIDKAKEALINDALSQLNMRAQAVPAGVEVLVGLVGYSKTACKKHALVDISLIANYNDLVSSVTNYTLSECGDGTDTNTALQTANSMLSASALSGYEKNIVLLSDGSPIARVCINTPGGCCWPDCPFGYTPTCGCNSGGGGGGGGGVRIPLNDKADFKIAAIGDVCNTDVNGCVYHYWPCSSCGLQDLTLNVTNLTTSMKSSGIKIYTAFYDTGGASNAAAMCEWSSDSNCPAGGSFAFAGNNVSGLFSSIIANLLSKPQNPIIINGSITVPFADNPNTLAEKITGWTGINSILSCDNSNVGLSVNNFSGGGSIIINNIKFDYCRP